MIIDLPNTTTSKISKELVLLREEGGANALGRVLTLILDTHDDATEAAISAANDASREHPMRVIALARPGQGESVEASLNAQIRVGGDAGASEVLVLHPLGEANSHGEAFGFVTNQLPLKAPHEDESQDLLWLTASELENISASEIIHDTRVIALHLLTVYKTMYRTLAGLFDH